MSLFPAYAEQAKEFSENQNSTEKPEWLENSSFKAGLAIVTKVAETNNEEIHDLVSEKSSSADDKIEEEPKAKRKKKEKKKKRYKKKDKDDKEATPSSSNNDAFLIDRKGTREYLSVDTISRPAVSKYHTKYYLTQSSRRKKRKFKRYYKLSKQEESKKPNEEETKLTKQNIDKAELGERDEYFTGFSQEEELSKMTAFYNKSLDEDPTDVQMWLKYVEFQDTVYQFEKTYRKGSIAKAQRVLADRKISILDKAIKLNAENEELLRERLKVAVSAFPADELQTELKKLVQKETDNIILWQGYIEATQCSMSHCNAPAVLSLYGNCLSTLHQLRRASSSQKVAFEQDILRMMYQCSLFLKQAGLFEQLWTLLKMYLELNLSPEDKDRFNIEKPINEKELLELEEVVLNSQLPHHELWLRTEKLRESCHWLPFVGEEECEDPQRIVFSEDVVELIQPITAPENTFRLVAITLTLLKIPLLPCRHSAMQELGLDYVPWSLDSVEMLLPVFLNLYPIDTINENLLKDTHRLAVGPQYLKVLPGQEEYLNFILSVMESCAECLKNQEQISLRVWWFRFLRLLIILDNQGRFKLPPNFKKRIKTSVKELLKREEFRNNEIFYIEYAHIEKALGNGDVCVKILKTALSMNKNTLFVNQNWDQSQVNKCSLYKNLVEVSTGGDDVKETVLSHLLKLVLQRDFDAVTKCLILEAETKFRNFTRDLLETQLGKMGAVDIFLPDFFSDWIVCHGWFLYWSKGALECGTFLENILSKLEDKQAQKELIYEFYCAVLFKYCIDHPGSGVFKILDDVLFRALEKFPNNLYLLAILAKEQSMTKNVGMSAWKVQTLLLKSGRSIATLFTVIIGDLVRLEMEKEVTDSITGSKLLLAPAFKNRMLSLYKKITKNDMCTRRCGLAWRMYLQFVHTYFDSVMSRKVYYSSVEECPWLKALYMDAAVYIPAELAQIQDLIIEKQLRLHVTPEELDILRS